MAGSFTGMDIEAVRRLAGQMDQCAQNIQEITGRLTSALEGTPWVGPDREQFAGEWQGTHRQQLTAVCNGLTTAANKARTNASEQETASGH